MRLPWGWPWYLERVFKLTFSMMCGRTGSLTDAESSGIRMHCSELALQFRLFEFEDTFLAATVRR